MKKILLALLMVLVLAVPALPTDCESPEGKTMTATVCCGTHLIFEFGNHGYSPYDPCEPLWLQITDNSGISYEGTYTWAQEACAITLKADVLGLNPLYLKVDGQTLTLSTLPIMSFQYETVSSMD